MKKNILRFLARVYYWLNVIVLFIPNHLGKLLRVDDLATNLSMPFAEAMERSSNVYMTFNYYPQKACDINSYMYYVSDSVAKRCCIVMRGLINEKYNFTLETVRLYSRIFPGVLVILSVWNDTPKHIVDLFEKESNCIVVKNDFPETPGTVHTNYQREVQLQGVRRAKEEGMEYVFVTRTDFRVTATGILDYLFELLEQYPVDNIFGNLMQKYRLIMFDTFLFQPYRSGDFFAFGYVDDLIDYFDSPMNNGKIDEWKSMGTLSYREMFMTPFGENWFLSQYFNKYIDLQCDLDQWWKVVATYLICLPLGVLNPIWYKYDYNHEMNFISWTYRRKMLGGAGIESTIVTYSMWLDLYHKRFDVESINYEYLLDEKL